VVEGVGKVVIQDQEGNRFALHSREPRAALPRVAALSDDAESRSVDSAFSIRRIRVSRFFALSIARTCSRLRPSGRRS
jgi:hypothetical protein